MKTTETRNLVGLALDYYVALSQGYVWRYPGIVVEEGLQAAQLAEEAFGNPSPPYSTDWAMGGPVIEAEEIAVRPLYMGAATGLFYDETSQGWEEITGPTMLIAAMRAVVAKHYGAHVPELKP